MKNTKTAKEALRAIVTAFPELDESDEPLAGADAVDRLADLWPAIKRAAKEREVI